MGKRQIKSDIITEQIGEFIKTNYKGTSCARMCKLIEEKFGGIHGLRQIESFYHRNNLHSGLTGCFKKNHTPFNKGVPRTDWFSEENIEKIKATQFKKGHIPYSYKPIGTEAIRDGGYVWVKVGEHNWQARSRKVWKEHYGEIPKGAHIVHLDGDRTNDDIENLEIVSNKEAIQLSKIGWSNDKQINKSVVSLARVCAKVSERKSNEL